MTALRPAAVAGTFYPSDPEELARTIRRVVLEQSKRAGVGHIGSALCVAVVHLLSGRRF